jgi:G3E family GTPase
VLTGFLGAGKTTLLNRLLKDKALAGCMVVVNELGEIGIDHLLVETREEVSLLASGCLCCALRGDLVTTLEGFCRDVDNGRRAAFPRLVLETTGLADPAPILATFAEHPYLRLRYRLASVVTAVDAVNGLSTLDAQPEAERQAAAADRIVLTKTDLATDAQALAALRGRLAALAPGVEILDAAKGEARVEAMLADAARDLADRPESARRWLGAEAADILAEAQAEDARHRGHDCAAFGCAPRRLSYKGIGVGPGNPADPALHGDIRATALRSDAAIAPSAFDVFLELLRGAHGPRLLRIKGLVKLCDDPTRPVVIQGAQHVIHPLARLERWPDADEDTRIVLITRDLDPAYLTALWEAFAQAPDSSLRA